MGFCLKLKCNDLSVIAVLKCIIEKVMQCHFIYSDYPKHQTVCDRVLHQVGNVTHTIFPGHIALNEIHFLN